ncbi:MAG: decaprenyl-phosphate phosphoribosyltransferase [Cyclobacteriaceae bacterium]|nr:decaprenyl-phosphate phosphoribosyltransferase [Cyclobacteriaceae bacterium]
MQFIKLLRVKHWIKNTFLFIPLFFSGGFFDFSKYPLLILGFISYSLMASCIYILNDIRDVESDRIHPEKRNRPIASGAISKRNAIILMVIIGLIGISLAIFIKTKFLFVLCIYLLLNILYSSGLKKIAILDIIIVAIGFNIRVKAGGVIAEIAISEWLMVMVFLLSLFIVIAKRRDDTLIKEKTGVDMRKVSSKYNESFLNVSIAMLASIIIVSYLIYTLSPAVVDRFETHRLYYNSIFVIAGILRYLQISFVENDSGSPTKLLYKDRFIQVCILLWLGSFYFLIYIPDFNIFG